MHPTPRVDFGDAEAEFYCLSCGERYRLDAGGCANCGAQVLISRREIAALLERSCPRRDPAELSAEPLAVLPDAFDTARLPAVREALRSAQAPYVQMGPGGKPLEPLAEGAVNLLAPVEPLRSVLAEEERRKELETEAATEMGFTHPEEHTVQLVAVPSAGEAHLIQACLDESGIPYQVNKMTSQLAFTSGALAAVKIHVAESDLEVARQALASLEQPAAEEDEDELAEERRSRVQRRYLIARLLLFLNGAVYLATAVVAFAVHPLDAAINVVLGLALIGLARGSIAAPRTAFLWSFLVLAGSSLWAMVADRPFLMFPGLLCLLAVYFAYRVATEQPAAESPTRAV